MKQRHEADADWIHRLVLPCAEVARLLGDPAAKPLALRDRLRLRVHLALCAFCSRYKRELHRLRAALQRNPAAGEIRETAGLSPTARRRLQETLRTRPPA